MPAKRQTRQEEDDPLDLDYSDDEEESFMDDDFDDDIEGKEADDDPKDKQGDNGW